VAAFLNHLGVGWFMPGVPVRADCLTKATEAQKG